MFVTGDTGLKVMAVLLAVCYLGALYFEFIDKSRGTPLTFRLSNRSLSGEQANAVVEYLQLDRANGPRPDPRSPRDGRRLPSAI